MRHSSHRRSRRRALSARLSLATLCLLGPTAPALADSLWWLGGSGQLVGANADRWNDVNLGLFGIGTNWSSTGLGTRTQTTLPTATTDVHFLATNFVDSVSVLGRDFTINSLTHDASPANTFVIIGKDTNSSQTLTVGPAGIMMNNTGVLEFQCNLNVTGTTTLSVNAADTSSQLVLQGTILAPTLVKSGPGTLELGKALVSTGLSANAFTSLIINGGDVTASVEKAIPDGSNITINSGSLTFDNTSTTVNNIVFGSGITGSGRTLSPGLIVPFPGQTVPTYTVQGNISYNGPGDPAVLSTDLVLSAGQHLINNPNGSFSNSFYDITFDGHLSGPGGYTKSGNAYMALTQSSTHTGSTIIEGGRVYLASFGALSQSSPLTVNAPGQLFLNPTTASTLVTPGNYGQTVPSLSGNGTIFLGTANLTVSGVGTSTFSGVITGTGALFKNGSSTLILSGENTYSNGTTISAGRLQIGDAGSTGSVAGNITNNAFLTFNRANNLAFPGAISGTGSLTHAGTGTLTLTGALTYSGNTSVTGGGKLVLSSALNTVTGDILLSNGSKVDFALARTTSPITVSRIDNLTIPSNAIAKITPSSRTGGTQQAVLVVNSLTITGTGFLDLTNNDLIVRSQSVASVRSLVSTWLTSNNGLPGTSGLGSSESFYTVNGAFTTLAVYDNSIVGQIFGSFEGVPVISTDVLVKYTYLGDTNIDGVVDASDLARLLQGMSGQGSGWNFGDVNYDGLINFTDLGRLQAALRGQAAPLSTTGSGVGSPGGAIPEPSSLTLLSLPALLLRRLPRATSRRPRRA